MDWFGGSKKLKKNKKKQNKIEQLKWVGQTNSSHHNTQDNTTSYFF